jgi:hypothetical protein
MERPGPAQRDRAVVWLEWSFLPPLSLLASSADDADCVRLRALGPLGDLELHALTFV